MKTKTRPWHGELTHDNSLSADWGCLRDELGTPIARVQVPIGNDDAESRRKNEDPTTARLRRIMDCCNACVEMDDPVKEVRELQSRGANTAPESLLKYRQRALKKAEIMDLGPDEGYAARIPGFSGLLAARASREAASAALETALEDWMRLALQRGLGLPAVDEESSQTVRNEPQRMDERRELNL